MRWHVDLFLCGSVLIAGGPSTCIIPKPYSTSIGPGTTRVGGARATPGDRLRQSRFGEEVTCI